MKKILIVEDDQNILRGLKDVFVTEHFEVHAESDGEKGYQAARRTAFDAMILDNMLPSMNGIEICKKLRAEGIRTPIIMLTSKGSEADRVMGLEFGADDYVTKPFSVRELIARVNVVLRRQEMDAGVMNERTTAEGKIPLQRHDTGKGSHYKILEKLGGGGMGVVYKAEDTRLKRIVALKFLPPELTRDPEAKARFIHEAQAASALQHDNICTIHDIDETDDRQLFICMDYYEGETLKKRIERGPLPIDEAVGLALQVANGLSKAHEAGMVHRDIKPANLMVRKDGALKIVDFGLAKLTGRTMLTKSGSTIGTVAYMSPEQARGESVDHRSDLWSLGIVLYEMIVGRQPFRGDYENAILYSILNAEAEPPSALRTGVPPELERIVFKCLAKDPSDRYQHADDLMVDLRRLKGDTSKTARAVSGAPLPLTQPPKKKRRKLLWASGAAVVLVGAVALFFLLWPKSVRLNPNHTVRTLYSCSYPTTADNFHVFIYPSISRDGNWVAFGVPDDSGKYDLFFMNASWPKPRRIPLREPNYLNGADISPNGELILFGGQSTPIRVVSSDGGEIRTVLDSAVFAKWAPRGDRISYLTGSAVEEKSRLEVWTAARDGSDRRMEWADVPMNRNFFWAWAFCLSPDGRSLGWIRSFEGGYTEVITADLKTGKERQLTFDKKLADEPVWMSNGTVLFMSNRSGKRSIWAVPETGGEPLQITVGGAEQSCVRVSDDGKRMLIPEVDGTSELWMSDMSRSNVLQFKLDFFAPAWSFGASDDLQRFTFAKEEPPEGWALYLTDGHGDNRIRFVVSKQRMVNPTFSPDARHLSYLDPERSVDNVSVVHTDGSGTARTFTVPRLMYNLKTIHWIDSEKFLVWDQQLRTYLCSAHGGDATLYFEDSTWARPIADTRFMFYVDHRKSSSGDWIVPLDADGKRSGQATKILQRSTNSHIVISPDGRTTVYEKHPGQWWKMALPSRKEEPIRKRPPLASIGSDMLSNDGKRMAYLVDRVTLKLLLLENVFE